MKLVSFSEYEMGVLAIGGMPTGIISIGIFPVGVVAIGIIPVGLLTFASGSSVGVVNFTCGIGVGAWVRCVGLGVGGDVGTVGLGLPLAGKRPTSGSSVWYWTRVALVAAVVLFAVGMVARPRLGLIRMSRVVDVEWTARPETTEGLYLAPETECLVMARMRSDGERSLHADVVVQCGSVELVRREIRSGCDFRQQQRDGGTVYDLACTAERVAATSDEDSSTPERPGLELSTFGEPGGRARVFAQGPPPMNVVLTVDSPSQRVDGEPLLLDRRTRLDKL